MSARVYLECAALLTLGYGALWVLRRAWLWAGGVGSARAWLRSAQGVLLAALILPGALRALPDGLFPAGLFSRSPLAEGLPRGAHPRIANPAPSTAGDPLRLVPPSAFGGALPRQAEDRKSVV